MANKLRKSLRLIHSSKLLQKWAYMLQLQCCYQENQSVAFREFDWMQLYGVPCPIELQWACSQRRPRAALWSLLCNRANRDWNAVGVLWFKRFDPEWRYIMLHYTLCSIPTHLCWTEHITTHWGWLIFHSFYFALHTMNLNFPRFFPSHV